MAVPGVPVSGTPRLLVIPAVGADHGKWPIDGSRGAPQNFGSRLRSLLRGKFLMDPIAPIPAAAQDTAATRLDPCMLMRSAMNAVQSGEVGGGTLIRRTPLLGTAAGWSHCRQLGRRPARRFRMPEPRQAGYRGAVLE